MSAPAAESKLFICPKSFCHNDSILFAIGTDILEQLMGNNRMHLAIPMAHPFTIATAVTSTFAWHSERKYYRLFDVSSIMFLTPFKTFIKLLLFVVIVILLDQITQRI